MAKTTPPSCRFIELVSPGLLFGDTTEMKWTRDSWNNIHTLGEELKRATNIPKSAVGFRRFVYDPSRGKVYKDRGWVYFKGVWISKEDALSGKAKIAHPGIPLTDIAISNIKCNNWDCLWIEEYGKLWPFDEDDKMA